MKQEYEYIGECKGNDGNGCFMDSPGHDCGCFVKKPKQTMKQTAVNWLLNNLHEIGVDHNLSIKAEKGWLEKRNEIIEKAKAMEKEQIVNAFDEGQEYEYQYHINNAPKFDPETYYNETYVGSNSVCNCTNFRETPMINGKYICSICNKPIIKENKQ